ncbi:RING-type E3 ubiquitin transferase [Ranunculus cassubicifolius]
MENPNTNNNNKTTTGTQESNNSTAVAESGSNLQSTTTRTPFSDLSQVDADLVLARTLQEQERAYMMLRINGEGGTISSDYGGESSDDEAGSYLHDDDDDSNNDDDDAFDVHENLENNLDSDEAFARALQDAEHQQLAARIMALTAATWDEDHSDDDTNSQDTWEEVDPDELSYEELIALGDVVGTESRGLSADTIASLPSINYKSQNNEDSSTDQCVICRLEYEDEDTLTVLSCKHMYHSECINNWLHINKVCPICSAEVSTSDKREEGSPVP